MKSKEKKLSRRKESIESNDVDRSHEIGVENNVHFLFLSAWYVPSFHHTLHSLQY